MMTDDLLHATVSVRGVIINSRGQICIVQRTTDDEWELPGGRLARSEDPVEGLQREIVEETSLSVDVGKVVSANSWVNDAGEDRFAVHYQCDTTEQKVELSTEHSDWAWVDPPAVSTTLCEPQTTAVRKAVGISAHRQQSTQSAVPQD